MTKEQRKQTRDILAALVKQDRYATLTGAARIVLAAAAEEIDQDFKNKLLMIAGKIQAIYGEKGPV